MFEFIFSEVLLAMASSSDIKSNEQCVEEEDSMSMIDVLQEEKQLEEDADAILGGSDSSQCTYAQVSLHQW